MPAHEQLWRTPDLHAILCSEIQSMTQRVVARAIADHPLSDSDTEEG
jgi:hypothetical protein